MNNKIIEILHDVLILLQDIDLIEPHYMKYRGTYQRRINKAYDEVYELLKVLEADDNE